MEERMVPYGYTAYLLGTSDTLGGLYSISPLEESAAEGTLMLMQLNFEDFPSAEVITELNQELNQAGVPPWPGYSQVAYADTTQATIYLCWVKGIAWMSVIIGILVLLVLPALLGAFIWWLLPESVKAMINMMIMVGVMVLMMRFMSGATEESKK
jgi:hypothetical protein